MSYKSNDDEYGFLLGADTPLVMFALDRAFPKSKLKFYLVKHEVR